MLGLISLMLGSIGIYGVMSFFVSQRMHEIGIRIALCATTRDVLTMVMREAIVSPKLSNRGQQHPC
jgi:ABC-type antimicrobial peptide transport system permease subunit